MILTTTVTSYTTANIQLLDFRAAFWFEPETVSLCVRREAASTETIIHMLFAQFKEN